MINEILDIIKKHYNDERKHSFLLLKSHDVFLDNTLKEENRAKNK